MLFEYKVEVHNKFQAILTGDEEKTPDCIWKDEKSVLLVSGGCKETRT